ncbi:MAG TPA: D-alanyl-D-alanine carboxypeptidase/D-alanyl-D-alanine-endopeptidase [Solirubrobacteraceae bacterium]|nr:D-alanyl-D-alanine carboxypeptidase/D-alanyl-D-alanine-endopeptidase [Solirubrobacteraceae bacterium]
MSVFFLFAPAASAAASTALAKLRSHIAHELAIVGPADGAYVYDLTAHRLLFSERAAVRRPPASVEKLYTSTTALELLGADYRLATRVFGQGHLTQSGVFEGNLFLRGGGDPTFGSVPFIDAHYGGIGTAVRTLAVQLADRDHIRRVTGSILGDETWWDRLRGDPSSGYAFDPYLEGQLSALEFNRGEDGPYSGVHAPGENAARHLMLALRSLGVRVAGRPGARKTPAHLRELAVARSPTLAQLLGLMLPPSDNFFAESLIKDLGALRAGAGTTAAGAAVVRRTIARDFGLHPTLVDGSGLSETDKTSPEQVSRLLIDLYPQKIGATLRDHLAVAGDTGTLEERMRGTAAQGRCQAKTGTLTGVSNLAGYCRAADGDTIEFAIFNDGVELEAAHRVQNNVAISLARY